jgi:hypothetical protein
MKPSLPSATPSRGKTLALLLFGLLLLGFVVVVSSDEKKVLSLLYNARGGALALAMLGAAGSMLAMTFSYRNLFQAVHHRVPFRKMFGVTLVCNAFNIVLSSGGVSGTTVRCLLLKREGVPNSVTLPISLTQAMVSNLVLVCLCAGMVSPLWHPVMETGFPVGRVVSAGILVLISLALLQAGGIFFPGFRKMIFQTAEGILEKFSHGRGRMEHWSTRLKEINLKLDDCVRLLGNRWDAIARSFLWLCADWGFYILTLGACFAGVGIYLEPGQLMVTFAAVFLTTEISVTPSGLGVSEGLVAWVLVRRGIPLEHALAGMLLFRAVYFFIPVVVALISHLDLMYEGPLFSGKKR